METPDTHPPQSATAQGSQNIIVQVAGNGNTTNVNLPRLTLIPPQRRARAIRTEIDLLNAYSRSIPLVGREADMDSLWNWLHSLKPVSVRVLKGRAGAGKTRLAIELIERLNFEKQGHWFAGFVGGREMRRFAGEQNLSDWGWSRPTLVVVDYAASLLEPLREWLRDLAQNPARSGDRLLRLLLLEREADSGSGWLHALRFGGQSDAGVPDLFDPPEPKLLDNLDTPEKRRAVLGQMLAVAATLEGCGLPKLPAAGEDPILDKQLENPQWEDPLYLMMAALLSLRSNLVAVLQLPRTELALQLVDHEISRLGDNWPTDSITRLKVHLAALASMGGGLTQDEALKLAEAECGALRLHHPSGEGALVAEAHEVLPASDQGIAAIIPDILAEALVLRAMGKCSASQQEEVVLRAVTHLGRRVVPFILRTVQDFVSGSELAPLKWLERLIRAGQTDDLGLLVEIESAMPHDTLVLREKAVEVNELLVERLEWLAQETPSEAIQSMLSGFRNNLANRLSDLGRKEEALTQAEGAVGLYRKMAKSRPDAFLPDLAMSLNNLAATLSDLGRREEALALAGEAVAIYRRLANVRPEAFLPNLAGSLNNFGNSLSDLGRREEALAHAEESLRIRRQLAKTRPEATLPDLASSLNNLANRLSALGRREEALAQADEALRIRRQLAQAQPDAFLPDLATTLNNLATMLSELGWKEEALARAEEAVWLYRQLEKMRSVAFLPNLAGSLNNLSTMMSVLGRREEALAHAEESVRIRRQLAKTHPEATLPELASSLNTLANMLSALGRREEALAQAEEAVKLYRQLAQARPDAFLPDLAMSFGARGAIFRTMEQHPAATASFAEGVRVLAPYFAKMPQAFAGLIGSLCQDYLAACEQTKTEPDMVLLAPVIDVFNRLEPDQPKE